MTTVSRADASAAQIIMAVLHTLLKDLHHRDFSVRLWDGSTWDPEPGQPEREAQQPIPEEAHDDTRKQQQDG